MSEQGTCKRCGKRLLWVDTRNGKRIPLDHEPVGRLFVLESGKDPMVAQQRNAYACHMDTCKGPR